MASRLTVNRGTTYNIGVTYQEDGVATSIVGATIFFTVRDEEYDTSDSSDTGATLTKTVTSHTDAANGESTIELSPTDTLITPGNYYYDIKIKLATGEIYKLDEGRFKVDGSPTNRQS